MVLSELRCISEHPREVLLWDHQISPRKSSKHLLHFWCSVHQGERPTGPSRMLNAGWLWFTHSALSLPAEALCLGPLQGVQLLSPGTWNGKLKDSDKFSGAYCSSWNIQPRCVFKTSSSTSETSLWPEDGRAPCLWSLPYETWATVIHPSPSQWLELPWYHPLTLLISSFVALNGFKHSELACLWLPITRIKGIYHHTWLFL